ncbi:MazG nucleotide pyrophosphohydrolase domain-containing protein [Streptomyces sp. NPDC047968]|uniref:nucleoside triphosphate pyrophosphohydrolase family protein n=1 Tax=Streptomyces sp. NPDC047968 TaxID=3155382 RepID=UPI00344A487D
MHFLSYQQAAIKTLQNSPEGVDPVLIPLLGLAGEVGSLATVYKKHLRDGPAFEQGKHQLREELGDVLWYIATLAHRFGLDLDDIAAANLEKTKDRWRTTPDAEHTHFDDTFPDHERLPRRTTLTFTPTPTAEGRTVVVLTREDGTPAGDPLTSASHIEDDYRFHDAFHLAHAAVLGWSPVTRYLLGRKRKSNPARSGGGRERRAPGGCREGTADGQASGGRRAGLGRMPRGRGRRAGGARVPGGAGVHAAEKDACPQPLLMVRAGL